MGSDPIYFRPEDITINLIERALLGTESRRGIWTDRDYLIAALAILTSGERARKAAAANPKVLLDANKPLKRKDQFWWAQYEEMANKLEEVADGHPTLSLAADDMRDLVSGLRDLERKLKQYKLIFGEIEGPDPTEDANAKDS